MTAAIDPKTRELLAEAAEWRLLSLLFDCPGETWREQVADLATEAADPDLRTCAGLALKQATAELYHSTFGPGGPAAPREVSYCDTLQLGYLMSELETYYAAFGYHPASAEAPDHVAVETGFVAFLRIKEAFAVNSGGREHAATTAEAAERFVREHVSRIAPPLAERLAESGLEFYADAARALHRRANAPPVPENPAAPALRVFGDDSLFSCGAGDAGDDLSRTGLD